MSIKLEQLEVVGHKLLIKPNLIDDEIREGALAGFQYQGEEHKREKAGTETGTIIGVGPMAWRAYDGGEKDWKPWASIGDEVYFARHAGRFIVLDDETWVMVILDDDVQAVIHKVGEY